jgi:hypothetical protein
LNDFGSNCLGDRSGLADEVGLAMAVLEAEDKTGSARAQNARPAIVIPFRVKGPLRKGLAGTPAGPQTIEPHARDALLQAIARSRRWIEAILKGEAATFEAIASAKGSCRAACSFPDPARLSIAARRRGDRGQGS